MTSRGLVWTLFLASCSPAPPVTLEPSRLDAAREPHPVFDEHLRRVASARGLEVLADVEVLWVSRAQLLREAMRQVDLEAPAVVLEERGYILRALRLVPEEFAFRQTLELFLSRTLVGLYDPFGARVLVANDSRTSDAAITRDHELAHALVDQHFGLRALVSHRELGADRHAALSALSEGDASSLMFDLAAADQGVDRSVLLADFVAGLENEVSADGSLPQVVGRLLAAPYVDGLAFVESLRAAGGWQSVDEAWRAPPETSEQVLHPDAYGRREPALAVAAPPPGPGCRRLYADVLGEQGLIALTSEWVGGSAARIAFEGWGGDQVATFDCPTGRAVVLALVGDDEAALERMVGVFEAGTPGCPQRSGGLGSAAALVYRAGDRCARIESPTRSLGLPGPGVRGP